MNIVEDRVIIVRTTPRYKPKCRSHRISAEILYCPSKVKKVAYRKMEGLHLERVRNNPNENQSLYYHCIPANVELTGRRSAEGTCKRDLQADRVERMVRRTVH